MKLRNLCICFFAAMLIGLAVAAGAEEEEENNEISIDEEVVVTATRISENPAQSPGLTEVVEGEKINHKETATAADVLMDHGFVVSTNGGAFSQAHVHLNGGSSEQTLVLVNGIAANTGCIGAVDLSLIPAAGIRRIELAHGPLSSLYGANALGGVVNIITGLTGDRRNTLSLLGGENNTGSLGFAIQRKHWGLAFGGNITGGHRERSKTNKAYLIGQYDFIQGNDEYLSLYWQYLTKANQVPGPEFYPYEAADQAEQNFSLNLNGKKLWLGGQWEYKVFGQSLDLTYDNDDPFFPEHDRHQAANYGMDMAGLYELANHELLGGVIFRRDHFDSTISGEHNQTGKALFLQDGWKLGGGLKLVTGLSWNYCSDYSSPLSPRVALVKSFPEDITLKIGYGKAFRAPTIHDLYWNQPEFGMYGNPDLKPEEGERYDLGGEWRQGKQLLAVNVFHSVLANGIRWADQGESVWRVENIDKMWINGFVVNWEKTWGDVFTGRIGYRRLDEKAWDDAAQSYTKDNNVFGANRLNLGFSAASGPWTFGANWYFVQKRSSMLSDAPMPDYDLGNFILQFAANEYYTMSVQIDNITNEQYQIHAGYPMPGRTIRLGMEYRF